MVTEVNKLKEVANEVEAGGLDKLSDGPYREQQALYTHDVDYLSVKWTDYLSSSYSTSRRILKISTIRVIVL